ncbi:hypothetical protein [Acidisoma sp. L85]|uniref:hypothetical protein n=1 Tax=Acidisoma sp. L85 TaxID=1641850 RepID=UPI00131E8D7B|nr:hypothetical protein [Acidisoma sp. L85]
MDVTPYPENSEPARIWRVLKLPNTPVITKRLGKAFSCGGQADVCLRLSRPLDASEPEAVALLDELDAMGFRCRVIRRRRRGAVGG